MLREPFFYIDRFRTVDDFGERLLADVAERDLSTMVEATGDYATVMKNRDMRIKRTTRSFIIFCANTIRPFESGVFVQVNASGDVEALVAAAKMPRRDFDVERFADAVQHVAVPR